MITNAYCKLMADYNKWMNIRLYELCGIIGDEKLRENKGAFFGSVYLTLNHIAYSDLAFLSRFESKPELAPKINVDLFGGFQQLSVERIKMDKRISEWAETLSPTWLQESLTYKSQVDGLVRTVPQWILVTHMFNHQTHHRGQVTTLLSQSGMDMGSTDIPFMPQFNAL
jgi:uncharacterized damage-inducible protein DinB